MKYILIPVIVVFAGAAYAFRGGHNSSGGVETKGDGSAPAATATATSTATSVSVAAPARTYPVRVDTVKTRSVIYEVRGVGGVKGRQMYGVDRQVAVPAYLVAFTEGDEVKGAEFLGRLA